jgi:hypothetical protein
MGAPCGFGWLFFFFFFCGLALVVSVYTSGILKGVLRVLIKSSYLSKKKKKKQLLYLFNLVAF